MVRAFFFFQLLAHVLINLNTHGGLTRNTVVVCLCLSDTSSELKHQSTFRLSPASRTIAEYWQWRQWWSSLSKFDPAAEFQRVRLVESSLSDNHHIKLALEEKAKKLVNLDFGCCRCKETLLLFFFLLWWKTFWLNCLLFLKWLKRALKHLNAYVIAFFTLQDTAVSRPRVQIKNK